MKKSLVTPGIVLLVIVLVTILVSNHFHSKKHLVYLAPIISKVDDSNFKFYCKSNFSDGTSSTIFVGNFSMPVNAAMRAIPDNLLQKCS